VGLKVGGNVVVRNAITNAGGAASAGAALVGNQPGVIQRALDLASGFPLQSAFRSSEMVDLSTKVPH